jgi:O-antigen ligase
VSALADRLGRYPLLYGGALLLAATMGASVAYSERFGGENGPYILLGVLMAITIAAAILLQWRLGAVLVVASLPYETILTNGAVASGIKALALLTFISCALALLTDQKLIERLARLWQQPLALAVLAFMLWVALSILWASDKVATLAAMVTFGGVFALMVVIGLLEGRYLVLTWAGLMVSAALSVPAGYILPVPEGSDMAVSGRFGPAGAGPDDYACLVAIAFFVAYFGLLKRHRIIACLLVPVFVYGIFATGSRTGLIALVATPLLTLFVPRLASRLGWRTLLLYVLGAIAIAVMVLAIPSVGQSALERNMTLSQLESERTWSGRWDIWQASLEVIASHPVLGVGEGNFAQSTFEESTWVATHSAAKARVAGVAHNIFLGIASQLGIVGLILFLGVLFFAFKAAVPIARRSGLGTGIFLALVVSMIAGMSLTWENSKIVYVLFGSVLALQLHYSARREPSPDEPEGLY